jgi:hypothetical protein
MKTRTGAHPQKWEANENTSKHNPKKKQSKKSTKNQVKTICKEDT